LRRREAAIRLQNERLPEAIAAVEALKAETYLDAASIKAAQERVRLWVRERRWFLLLTEVSNKIDANPYPGKYYRLRELVCLLTPNVSQREWAEIFYWFRIDNIMVHLPVEIVDVDIELPPNCPTSQSGLSLANLPRWSPCWAAPLASTRSSISLVKSCI
jgi:hypothetical protein